MSVIGDLLRSAPQMATRDIYQINIVGENMPHLIREVEALENDAAIWRAVREDDDLVSRLESVAMSWCLAGLGDALERAKRRSTKSYADLVNAMKYAMGASALNADNANGAGDRRLDGEVDDERVDAYSAE